MKGAGFVAETFNALPFDCEREGELTHLMNVEFWETNNIGVVCSQGDGFRREDKSSYL